MKLRTLIPALCVLFLVADVDARSPARTTCTLSKKDQKKALNIVKKRFPQIESLAKERGCYCNFATEDCSLVDVSFESVEIDVPESKMKFQLRTSATIWIKKKPKNAGSYFDPVDEFDFEKAAKSIRKMAGTKKLFGEEPLVCDADGSAHSVGINCATKDPRAQMGGGRPKAGAKVIRYVFNHNKEPMVWLLAGPLDVVSKMDDWRVRSALRRPKVEAFLEKNSSPTVVIRTKEVELLGEGYDRVSVRFD